MWYNLRVVYIVCVRIYNSSKLLCDTICVYIVAVWIPHLLCVHVRDIVEIVTKLQNPLSIVNIKLSE
jgi:hypothetical protein